VLVLRHCTLVPGWGLECDCEPSRPAEPSLELYNIRATVRIEHSILGSIQVHEDEVKDDPIPVRITDSILDATAPEKEALGAPGYAVAHAVLTMLRCTVFGIVDVHAVALAENCIFNNCLNVARRQLGCMRFCHVPYGCRTPRRYHCQPDLASQTMEETLRAAAAAESSRTDQVVLAQLKPVSDYASGRSSTASVTERRPIASYPTTALLKSNAARTTNPKWGRFTTCFSRSVRRICLHGWTNSRPPEWMSEAFTQLEHDNLEK
jgi:hypothetical protein